MNSIIQYLYTTAIPKLGLAPSSKEEAMAAEYRPSVQDVLDIKTFLFEKSALPVELLDTIIDYAEYWPHTTVKTTTSTSVMAGANRENRFILRSYPLGFLPSQDEHDPGQMLPHYLHSYPEKQPNPWPADKEVPNSATEEVLEYWRAKSEPRIRHPCRKLVFTLKSHDQGWGGDINTEEDKYAGSFTWFDIGLEKMSATKETMALESWELAPFPQFRLVGDYCEPVENPNISRPPIVCSLRTIRPKTKVADRPPEPYIPPNHRKPDDVASDNSDPEDENKPKVYYEFEHELLPSARCLQKNLTAVRKTTEHVITWRATDNVNPESLEANELAKQGRGAATAKGVFVESLELGDVVTVWAKARFPGWTNNVEDVQIDVYWMV